MFIQKIKHHIRGIVGWAVIIGISIPFATFGVAPYVGSTVNPDDLVVVGERSFNRTDVGREIQVQRNKIIKLFGQDRMPANFDDNRIFRMAIDEMVANELTAQYSAGQQMAVGNAQLVEYIQTLPDLQGDDGFEIQKVNDLAVEQGLTVAQFEDRYRDSIVRKQLEISLSQSYLANDNSVHLFNLINAHKRNVSIFTLPTDYFIERADVSEDQILDYHQNNADAFMAPEQLSVEYLMLDRTQLIDGIKVDEQELRKAYQQNLEVAGEEQKRQARHILIELDEDAEEARINEAFEQMNALRAELDGGASFEDLAREHSDDPGSAARGGDLGEVSRGVMVKPFEEALFALEEGGVSDVVTTQFGLHLIYLEKIIQGEDRTFEEMEDEVKTQVAEEKSFQVYEEKLAQLRALLESNPDDLEAVAEDLSLEIQRTELSERGALAEPFSGFDDQLFAPEFLETPNKLTEVLELPESAALLARKLEYVPTRQRELAEVREDIIERVKQDYSRDQINELRLRIEAKLAVSDKFASLTDADFAPLEREDYNDLSRAQTQGLPGNEIQAIFSMRYPGATIGLEEEQSEEESQAQIINDGPQALISNADDPAPQTQIENSTTDVADSAAKTDEVLADVSEGGADVDGSDVSASAPIKDYSHLVLDSSEFKFVILHSIVAASDEALTDAQESTLAQIQSNHRTGSLGSLYQYLQSYVEIDLSGLQGDPEE